MTDNADDQAAPGVALGKVRRRAKPGSKAFAQLWATLSPEGKIDLAKKVGLSYTTLSSIASGGRPAGLKAAVRIEDVTGIPRAQLRPDLYA